MIGLALALTGKSAALAELSGATANAASVSAAAAIALVRKNILLPPELTYELIKALDDDPVANRANNEALSFSSAGRKIDHGHRLRGVAVVDRAPTIAPAGSRPRHHHDKV